LRDLGREVLESNLSDVPADILIPLLIVFMTPKMLGLERMLKFGFGFMYYIISTLFLLKMPDILLTGLGPCLIISLAVLFYGKELLNKAEEK